MNQLSTILTFIAGTLFGGLIADTVGDFLLLLTGTIAITTALACFVSYWNEDEPRQWDRAVGYGSTIGLGLGLMIAIIDTNLPS